MHTVLREIMPKLFSAGMSSWKQQWQQELHTDLTVVFTPNPEQVVQAVESDAFRADLWSGDYLLPDGIGLILADRWSRWRQASTPWNQIQGRIPGSEVVRWWLSRTQAEGRKTLLLGSYGDTAAELATAIDPSGAYCRGMAGYSDVGDALGGTPSANSQHEEAAVRQAIKRWKPEVIFVGFGAPWQERWVMAHHSWLQEQGVKIVMVCGGAFDVLTKRVPTPPAIVRVLGMEWLFRLIVQPWRWRRQLRLIRFLQLLA